MIRSIEDFIKAVKEDSTQWAKEQPRWLRGEPADGVEVELIEAGDDWSQYLSPDDARKLDDVREALRRGDIHAASRLGRVFSLTPISG